MAEEGDMSTGETVAVALISVVVFAALMAIAF